MTTPTLLTVLAWDASTWIVVVAAGALVVAIAVALPWKRATAPGRSAEEARRSREIAEESLALERQRSHREIADYTERVAPRWEATEPDQRGYFHSDGSQLEGALRNAGLHGARVLLAVLDVGRPRVRMQTRCDGDWEDQPHVPPGSVLQLRCELDGVRLDGGARPMLYMDYDAPGLDRPGFGVTVELLASGGDHRGRRAWRVGAIRPDVRP
ncbi:MAG: hypothetical protein M3N47_13530 [Chloroflexota bacterium]|nr:hypothetical protein [Chloroflexota bacterium]